jgi:glycosyltransferase involved in cell wall biosynthesis
MNTKQPIRVAFLDDHLSFGGATIWLIQLLPKLRDCGLEVRVIASDLDNDMGLEFIHSGTMVQYYSMRNKWNLYDDRLMQVYRLLAEYSPHVVVINHEHTSFDLLRYVPAGVFRIAVAHLDNWETYRLMLRYAPWIDKAVGVSRSACRSIGELPVAVPLPVAYIPNGVTVPDSLPPRYAPDDALRILYIGRLVRKQKEVQRFVPIWQEIVRRDLPVEWTFLGDGNERDYLEKNMVSTVRQHITFVGEVAHDRVEYYCSSHDVIVLVSSYEGLSIGVLEGMSHGLVPVLTRERGGTPEMLDSSCGFCVPPDDPVAFVDALEKLLLDDKKRISMSNAAYEKVRAQYTYDNHVRSWNKLILDGAKNDVCWPKRVCFLGMNPRETNIGRMKRIYYNPAVRPARRLIHWCCIAAGRGWGALARRHESRSRKRA